MQLNEKYEAKLECSRSLEYESFSDLNNGDIHGINIRKNRTLKPKKTNIEPIVVKLLVDTGALHLCIPEHIAIHIRTGKTVQT